MKITKFFKVGITILVVCACLVSCEVQNNSAVRYDDAGSPIRLNAIPQTIISLAPSNTEIIYALELQDKLVGVTEFCNYPPEAVQKTRVGEFSTADIEKIVALHPDLIRTAGGNNIAQSINGFGSINLESVLVSDPDVIIAPTDMDKPQSPIWDYITSEPRLKTTSALKNNRIYKMDGDTIYRSSPRAVSALEQIASFIHPELFRAAR